MFLSQSLLTSSISDRHIFNLSPPLKEALVMMILVQIIIPILETAGLDSGYDIGNATLHWVAWV